MNTARFLMPIFTLHDFLYLLLDFLLAGYERKKHFILNLHIVQHASFIMVLLLAHIIQPHYGKTKQFMAKCALNSLLICDICLTLDLIFLKNKYFATFKNLLVQALNTKKARSHHI